MEVCGTVQSSIYFKDLLEVDLKDETEERRLAHEVTIVEEESAERMLIKDGSDEETKKCSNLIQSIGDVEERNADSAIKEIGELMEEENISAGLWNTDGVKKVTVEDSSETHEETDEQEENKNTQIRCGNFNGGVEINEIKSANLETYEKVEERRATKSDHLAALKVEDSDHQVDHEDCGRLIKANDLCESEEFNQDQIKSIKTCDEAELNKETEVENCDDFHSCIQITDSAAKDDIKEVEESILHKHEDEGEEEETDKKGSSSGSIFCVWVVEKEEAVKVAIPDSEENEGSNDIHKRKSDDSNELLPSAKVAKLELLVEPKPENPEPESHSEPEPENPDETAKKSEINTDLIQKILQNPMTSTWESQSHKPYELHAVSSETSEYKTVKAIFDGTRHFRMTLTKIERIENPYLLGMYLMKKEKMERNRRVEERDLFHGTRKSNLDGICRFNFDWRRKGRSRGHKFGQGVSFSPKASYAHHYNFDDHVMILAKVLVSKVKEGDCNTVVPVEPYDSTRNHTGDVIVKYSDDDFYPQYIVHYHYREAVNYFYDTDSDDDMF